MNKTILFLFLIDFGIKGALGNVYGEEFSNYVVKHIWVLAYVLPNFKKHVSPFRQYAF